MNEREQLKTLIDRIPSHKLGYALAYLQGLLAGETPQAEPESSDNLMDDPEIRGEIDSLIDAIIAWNPDVSEKAPTSSDEQNP